MGIKLVRCKTTIAAAGANPARTYFFLAPKGLYTGGIATACGITQGADTDNDEPVTPVKELLLYGIVERIHARATKGTKIYQYAMLCAAAKQTTVATDLKGKTVSTEGVLSTGSVIQRTVNPRRAVSY